MQKVVPLFKSFTITFYLKFLEFGEDTFGSNQFKSFWNIWINRGGYYSPLARPISPLPRLAHALDSLLPCSHATPTASCIRRSHVLPAARPPLARAHHTGPLSSLLTTHRARTPSPHFPPLSRRKEATKRHHLSSSTFRARFLSPQPTHHLCHLSSSPRPPLTIADCRAHRIPWRTVADPPLTVSFTHPVFPSTLKLRLTSLYLLRCPRTLPLSPATTGARRHHRKHRHRSPFPSPCHCPACSVSRIAVLLARRTHRGPTVP
jgi:hypothetical protein